MWTPWEPAGFLPLTAPECSHQLGQGTGRASGRGWKKRSGRKRIVCMSSCVGEKKRKQKWGGVGGDIKILTSTYVLQEQVYLLLFATFPMLLGAYQKLPPDQQPQITSRKPCHVQVSLYRCKNYLKWKSGSRVIRWLVGQEDFYTVVHLFSLGFYNTNFPGSVSVSQNTSSLKA